jgi:hypothetical protein
MTSKMVVGAVEASTDQRDGVLGKQHNCDPGHCRPQPAATAEHRWTGSFADRSDQVGNRIGGSESELPTQSTVLRRHGRACGAAHEMLLERRMLGSRGFAVLTR